MSLFALWTGMVGGPLIWLIVLEFNYALSPAACRSGDKSALIIGTSVALLLSLIAAFIAWRSWHAAGPVVTTAAGDALTRCRFMALTGLGLSVLIIFLIMASFLPIAILEVCD
jgi:hypothetical protein